MGNDVFEFTPQSTFTAISEAPGPGRMEGVPPMLEQTALSEEQALQREYQILSLTSISCNNYGLSSTILNIIPVTFGILDLLAPAGKCSEAKLFKYGPE